MVLKSILCDVSMATSVFLWMPFAWRIIFHPFTLSLFVFGAEVGHLKATYSCILFWIHPTNLAFWLVSSIYSYGDYWYIRTYYNRFIFVFFFFFSMWAIANRNVLLSESCGWKLCASWMKNFWEVWLWARSCSNHVFEIKEIRVWQTFFVENILLLDQFF